VGIVGRAGFRCATLTTIKHTFVLFLFLENELLSFPLEL
jgi:hypothetical protein